MAFDRTQAFALIEEKLNEIRIMCNRAMIPFIWVAAIADNGNSTEYKVAIDPNQDGKPLDPVKYACHGLIPGSMEIELADDKLRDIVKVLNGFKVVAQDKPMTIDPEEFSFSKTFPQKGDIYKYDEEEGGYVMPTIMFEPNEESGAAKEEPSITLPLISSTSLPRLEEDFAEPKDTKSEDQKPAVTAEIQLDLTSNVNVPSAEANGLVKAQELSD